MCSAKARCAHVVLPLAIHQIYSYALPPALALQAEVGMRVVVNLGKRKLYTGIITEISENLPLHPLKDVLELLDDVPIITPQQLTFWHWMADYYMCTLGEVMQAALPAGLKLASESMMVQTQLEPNWTGLTDHEYTLLETLRHRQILSLQEAAEITGLRNPVRIVNQLLREGYIGLEENLKTVEKPKSFTYVKLFQEFSEAEFNALFEKLTRAPKQAALLLAFLDLRENFEDGLVPKPMLIKHAQVQKSVLDALIAKEILATHAALQPPREKTTVADLHLSPAQAEAKTKILAGFNAKKPVLLHGITGSGKTEIYISLLKDALTKHKRALYLVPEIALTAQLTARLQQHFGRQVVVYHSRISQGERLAIYSRLLHDEEPLLLMGARSALLLPLPDLGLIVIDEEHDASFKQQDPAPRYQARDSALVLAQQNNCPILMGSATPSLESYYHAANGRYALVALHERFGGVQLPEIKLVDIRRETLWKRMRGHFSPRLIEYITEILAQNKKVILFQNRRGYSPVIRCNNCGHTQECPNCDITLTYHKYSNKLTCHYCGHSKPPPPACPVCSSTNLREMGFGTEKLEEELETILPEARIARLDFDSTRRKHSYNKIIERFAEGEIDVLIGTQMVTKGLDFDDVLLVGILSADSMLHHPDFRAHERAFQLMAQVAGRAGRRAEQGSVAIQTYRPDHPVVAAVRNHDYEGMVKQLLTEREVFKYPPFTRLLQIELRHKNVEVLNVAAQSLASHLIKSLGERVLGPEFPPIARTKNVHRKRILLKLERNINHKAVKKHLRQLQEALHQNKSFKGVRVIFDVDP